MIIIRKIQCFLGTLPLDQVVIKQLLRFVPNVANLVYVGELSGSVTAS